MSDLIKKRDAIEALNVIDVYGDGIGFEVLSHAIRDVSLLPTVEAEPVRHGRWVEYPECLKYENALGDIDIVCSCCEEVFNIMDNDTDRFDYCPNCGAKMDKRKKNDV